MPIVVASNDQEFHQKLSGFLAARGYRVAVIEDFDELRHRLGKTPPSVVIVDQSLQGGDITPQIGILRKLFTGPLVIVTSMYDSVDYIVSLEMGADDFVSKSISLRELLARLRVLIRRSASPSPTSPIPLKIYEVDGWTLIYETRELVNPHRAKVVLTPAERHLLSLLMANVGVLIERQRVHVEIMHTPFNGISRGVDNLVSRLRSIVRKLGGEMKAEPGRGLGYVFYGFTMKGEAENHPQPASFNDFVVHR